MAKNLIFQCWIDHDYRDVELPKYAKISSSLMSDYAKKCGADYMFYNAPFFPEYSVNLQHTTHEKMRIIYDESYDEYDNVVYVDTDIIPHDKCPNIFEEVNRTSAYIESYEKGMIGSSVLPADVRTTNSLLIEELYEMHNTTPKILDVGMNELTFNKIYRWFNTGVMFWTREDRLKARKEWQHFHKFKQSPHRKFSATDEGWFNIQNDKTNFGVEDLGIIWNTTPLFYRDTRSEWVEKFGFKESQIPNANFYHFSGGDGKRFIENDDIFNTFYKKYCK